VREVPFAAVRIDGNGFVGLGAGILEFAARHHRVGAIGIQAAERAAADETDRHGWRVTSAARKNEPLQLWEEELLASAVLAIAREDACSESLAQRFGKRRRLQIHIETRDQE
jgi:hypothetical protein